jgi:hypothetical protein
MDECKRLEFDDTGLIRRYRSYYDKLAEMEKIASGLPGVSGWFARALIGYLVAQGRKGLDISLMRPAARRSVCAAGQPAFLHVSRYIRLSGSDREFASLTG